MNKKSIVIAKNTFIKNIKSPGYLILLLSPILFLLIGGIAFFVLKNVVSDNKPNIGIVSANNAVYQTFKQQKNIRAKKVISAKKAESQLQAKKLDGYIITNNDISRAEYIQLSEAKATFPVEQMQPILTGIKTQLTISKLGLSPENVSELTSPVNISTKVVSVDDNKKINQTEAQILKGINYVFTIAIFVISIYYASIAATEIGSDKGSKTLQGILAAVSKKNYFIGKMTGVFLLLAFHIIFYIFLLLIAKLILSLTKYKEIMDSIKIPALPLDYLFIVVMLSAITIASILGISAMLGSFVSRSEDVQKATSPVSMILMIPYLMSLSLQTMPNLPIVKTLSYIPIFSQQLMPLRMASQVATFTNGLISVIIAMVALVIIMYFSYKVYDKHALDYSENTPFKVLISAITQKKS
ncbi:MAG: ABC transporter permease [Lactobacillaceae bacterium]|jgi:ABC-2 type transport system permease protein|nr:ABC transporter permease [Lactobacillaceae bacterium]